MATQVSSTTEQVADLVNAVKAAQAAAAQIDLRLLRGNPGLKAEVLTARTNLQSMRVGLSRA